MRSGISSFERAGWFSGALLRKDMTRFWPLWAVYALSVFLSLPLTILTRVGRGYMGTRLTYAALEFDLESAVLSAAQAAPYLGALFGVMAAMALFSYLMDHRSSQMIHALPVRREGLFLTQYAAAAGFFLIPQAVCALMAFGAAAARGVLLPGAILTWLAVSFSSGMLFFSFAAVCAMFTGHLLALPVFYGILNFLAMGLDLLVDSALGLLLTGYRSRAVSEPAVRWLTPLWQVSSRVKEDAETGALVAVCYSLVLGAAFTAVALAVYRQRRLERAGDVVTVGWMRPVFRWGVGVCVGLTMGALLYGEFFTALGPWGFVGLTAGFGAVGWFAAQMLLKKSLRIFREGWKEAAAFTAVMLVFLVGVRLDLTGYQHWTPDPGQVDSVTLGRVYTMPSDGGSGWLTLEDEDLVRAAVRVHADLVRNLDRVDFRGPWTGGSSTMGLELVYRMKDGRTVIRNYENVLITADDLARGDSYASELQALVNDRRAVEGIYLSGELAQAKRVTASAGMVRGGEGAVAAIEPAQAQRLWEAFREDLAAGRYRRWLLADADEDYTASCTEVTLQLQLGLLMEEIVLGDTLEEIMETEYVTFQVQRTATSTLAVLAELKAAGLLGDGWMPW